MSTKLPLKGSALSSKIHQIIPPGGITLWSNYRQAPEEEKALFFGPVRAGEDCLSDMLFTLEDNRVYREFRSHKNSAFSCPAGLMLVCGFGPLLLPKVVKEKKKVDLWIKRRVTLWSEKTRRKN